MHFACSLILSVAFWVVGVPAVFLSSLSASVSVWFLVAVVAAFAESVTVSAVVVSFLVYFAFAATGFTVVVVAAGAGGVVLVFASGLMVHLLPISQLFQDLYRLHNFGYAV